MHYSKTIRFNQKMKRKSKFFPSLPKIFKENKEGETMFNEINPGHTHSVMRGYRQRVNNFIKLQKTW